MLVDFQLETNKNYLRYKVKTLLSSNWTNIAILWMLRKRNLPQIWKQLKYAMHKAFWTLTNCIKKRRSDSLSTCSLWIMLQLLFMIKIVFSLDSNYTISLMALSGLYIKMELFLKVKYQIEEQMVLVGILIHHRAK